MSSLSSKKVNSSNFYIGTPTILSAKQSYSFHFCNFVDLPSKKGERTKSPTFECQGFKWRLRLCPGGDKKSKEGYISLFLDSLNGKTVKTKTSFHIPKINCSTGDDIDVYREEGRGRGWRDFKKREDIIISCLDDNGTLTIRVDMQVYTDKHCGWKPKETLKNDILKMFKSGDNADASFSVEGEIIKAHRFILKSRAPLLSEIVEVSSSGTDIDIPSVKEEIFRSMLEFLYTDKCPDNMTKDYAIKMLVAANKFGCQRLKLLVEVELIEKYLNLGAAVDLLLLADGNSCALLKESAMNLVARNISATKQSSPDWIKIKESSDILDEVISNVAGENLGFSDEIEDEYSNLSVREILEKLEAKNLDVDGTRQILLRRLRDQ